MAHNPGTDTIFEVMTKRLDIVTGLAEALVKRKFVKSGTHSGHLDELYVSCHRPGVVRARITDDGGRVHHVDAEQVEVL